MSKKKGKFKFKYRNIKYEPTKEELELANNKFVIDGKCAEYEITGELNLHNIPHKRNPKWQPLDWKYIETICGHCSRFEYLMCENQCKDNDMAIKAIFRSRKANDDLSIYLSWVEREHGKEKYIRTHYNDLEDDNYERQEVRMLNG